MSKERRKGKQQKVTTTNDPFDLPFDNQRSSRYQSRTRTSLGSYLQDRTRDHELFDSLQIVSGWHTGTPNRSYQVLTLRSSLSTASSTLLSKNLLDQLSWLLFPQHSLTSQLLMQPRLPSNLRLEARLSTFEEQEIEESRSERQSKT